MNLFSIFTPMTRIKTIILLLSLTSVCFAIFSLNHTIDHLSDHDAMSLVFIILSCLSVLTIGLLALSYVQGKARVKHVRDEFIQQQKRFDAALSTMHQGFCMFNSNGIIVISNERFATIYGLSPEQMKLGLSLRQIVETRIENGCYLGQNPDEYRAMMSKTAVLITGIPKIYQLNNGRYIEICNRPTSEGGWLSSHEDVTDRINAESELTHRNERLAAAISTISQGLGMFDGNQKLIVANEHYATMYGVAPDMIKPGMSLTEVFALRKNNDLYNDVNSVEDVMKLHQKSNVHEASLVVHHLKDGRYIEVRNQPMLQGGWLSTHEDITKRKQEEEQILDHRDHLQEQIDSATMELKQRALMLTQSLEAEKELNTIQRKFVSMASHEFRTPLAIIDGAAQHLKLRSGRFDPDDTEKRVEKIRSAVIRMTNLMESTLTVAQMDEGKIAIKVAPCEISKIVDSVCERQQDIAAHHKITYRADGLPEFIKADSDSLEQMLTNLLSNAIKYAPDNPYIDVHARIEGDNILISVHDQGLGIDEEDLPLMFERFFRAKTSAGITGTGIGLNLVKNLVEMHDGTLSLKSKIGEGSTFTISLPVEGPAQKDPAQTNVA